MGYSNISKAPAYNTAVSIVLAMTALRFDAVLSVKIIHRIEPDAEPTQRHHNVYKVREVSLDSLSVLSAFVACHYTQSRFIESYNIRLVARKADMGLEVWREIATDYNGRAIKG